ncbi:hypothetical protein Y032_0204g1896 [Ancylostoma ceylanicum]|uniref:Uncharacterized protein n=1 Tax=Ancylostoma ceylanicum TaxID=53326 RepID=A0A016SLQ1_9BILA|nr:hypothetical protein Y032_0204g1896 [Ancylostoma ceylanicum]
MSDSSELEDSGIKPYWFIIFEICYIVIFVAISVAIHLFGFLKTDEDAVTIHHKIHKEVIAQQERKFMSQNKENFIKTGKSPR